MNAAVTDNAAGPAGGRPGPGRRRLDSLPTRARTTGEAAAARSRVVRRLRVALPVIAVVLVAAFIFNTRSNNVDPAFLKDFEDLSVSTEDLRVARPRFAGVDEKGKPFEITADSAKQRPGESDIVELEMPRAVQGDAQNQTVVTAEKGLYRSEMKILELEDGVMLEHEIGADNYVLRSPNATVSIKDEVVIGNAGVVGEGSDGGALKAERMTAYRAEGRVVFEGDVSMRIYPKSARNADGANAGASDDEQKGNTP